MRSLIRVPANGLGGQPPMERKPIGAVIILVVAGVIALSKLPTIE